MKYLYTTEPDEGCHEINGVYGRPVHTSEQSKLKAKGWKENPDDLRKDEKEGREEKEVSKSFTLEDMEGYANQIAKKQAFAESDEELVAKYEEVIGKKPHHKMKPDTMKAKIDEALKDE